MNRRVTHGETPVIPRSFGHPAKLARDAPMTVTPIKANGASVFSFKGEAVSLVGSVFCYAFPGEAWSLLVQTDRLRRCVIGQDENLCVPNTTFFRPSDA